MGTPQDSIYRRRQRVRRAKKNLLWDAQRAAENAAAAEPKQPAKKTT